jgi:hypothetical protein
MAGQEDPIVSTGDLLTQVYGQCVSAYDFKMTGILVEAELAVHDTRVGRRMELGLFTLQSFDEPGSHILTIGEPLLTNVDVIERVCGTYVNLSLFLKSFDLILFHATQDSPILDWERARATSTSLPRPAMPLSRVRGSR